MDQFNINQIVLKCQQKQFQVFFGAEPPTPHAQPLVTLALHANGTLAYCLPGLEPGGYDDDESMDEDSVLESDSNDDDRDDDDDDVVIVYERLVQV